MKESALYPPVEAWATKQFNCWRTGVNTGPKVGRIDVVGVSDVGGDLSGQAEVIAIEVKAGTQVFATAAGQAHGYSVMADRCYLADLRTTANSFTHEEIRIAGRLGIGLLEIRKVGRGFQLREIVTAPPSEPIEELRLQVLDKIGVGVCAVCRQAFAHRGEDGIPFSGVTRQSQRGNLAKAKAQETGFMWWLAEAAKDRDRKGRGLVYWRRYMCPDCVALLG